MENSPESSPSVTPHNISEILGTKASSERNTSQQNSLDYHPDELQFNQAHRNLMYSNWFSLHSKTSQTSYLLGLQGKLFFFCCYTL